MPYAARLAPLFLLALPLLDGCARCSDEPRVPFKLKPPAASAEPDAGAAPSEALAHSFPKPVDHPRGEAGEIALTSVRALLEVDLDGDRDRDLLALHEDATRTLQLSASSLDAGRYGAARAVGAAALPELPSCALDTSALWQLSENRAALLVRRSCGPESAAEAPRTSLLLLSLEALPRVHERIDVLANELGEPAVTVTASSEDSDGDGRADVVLSFALPTGDPLRIPFLDRGAGLVRDLREPEATLAAWAAAAQSLAGKAPEQAIARAELALSLQRALCREGGAARVVVSGALGLSCGGKSSATLLGVSLAAHARRGAVASAFELHRRLLRVEPRPDARTLESAASALKKLPAEPGVTLARGPRVEPIRAPRIHLPSARFVGENVLYVQRARPVLYDLERGQESPAPSADSLLRDPSGQLIASALERGCDGLFVRIERAPPRGSDYVSSKPVSLAPLLPTASAPGCSKTLTRPDDGGFQLLGWAPQGLLAARGTELLVVPLGASGEAMGPARTLAADAPRPAPLPSGVATADGARYVEPTAHGLLLFGPSSSKVELWRPEGYAEIANGPLEAAISPSARRVALVAGGEVYLLEKR